MRKFRRSKKALSPVVASIILIAVTIAVSVAVAAWMGALTIGFMGGSEQLEFRNIAFFTNGTDPYATLTLKNTGTSGLTIQECWINNVDYTPSVVNATTPYAGLPLAIGDNVQFDVYVTGFSWTTGNNYQFKIVTAKGNPFMRNAIPAA